MASIKDRVKGIAKSVKEGNERGSRQSLIEELFYDFNRSKAQVYTMNFVRGIFFGAGSVLGGTVVIALLVGLLGLLGNVIPPLGDFFDGITSTIEAGPVNKQ